MAKPPKPSSGGFKVSLGSLLKLKLADVPPELAIQLADAPVKEEPKDEEGRKLVLRATKKSGGRRTKIRTRLE